MSRKTAQVKYNCSSIIGLLYGQFLEIGYKGLKSLLILAD